VKVLESHLDGPLLIEPVVHGDDRGFFQETFRQNVYASLGITDQFVQDNHSRSGRGIVRGMHFQPGMAKLVRCVRGEIFDVVVDLRRDSPAFGQWEGFTLDDVRHHQLYCPDGFAHGFCVVSEVADVVYKTSRYYDPQLEAGFAYDDPEVGIAWPQIELMPSARDARAPRLAEIAAELPF
jgi:dTDP-4-dehydrorhamnose 3,5-epimerase